MTETKPKGIPPELLVKIRSEPWYEKCALTGRCPVQIHHHLRYQGRKLQELFSLIPLHPDIHARVHEKEIREKCAKIVWARATEEERKKYGLN